MPPKKSTKVESTPKVTEEPVRDPGKMLVPLIEVYKSMMPRETRNDGKLDMISIAAAKEDLKLIKEILSKAAGNGDSLQSSVIGTLLSYSLEYLDIEEIRKRGELHLLPFPTEEEAEIAFEIYNELHAAGIDGLLRMRKTLVFAKMSKVISYIESWRTKEKIERVFLPDITAYEALKNADNNRQLMDGSELPPKFSHSYLKEIRENIEVISRHSVMNNFDSRLKARFGPVS